MLPVQFTVNLICIIVFALFTSTSAITGEIISGKAWQLNHIPHVRYFLEQESDYEGLTITYIRGLAPILHIKNDDGVEIETIDLSSYKTEGLVSILKCTLYIDIL